MKMATVFKFEELEVWKISREINQKLAVLIREDRFGRSYRLINQMEGAAGSVMDNVAEGFERGTRAEFKQFLGYAKGSCGELRSQFYRALDYGYLGSEEFKELNAMAVKISSMISAFIKYLQNTELNGHRKKK
jgi:four helix bundle protein